VRHDCRQFRQVDPPCNTLQAFLDLELNSGMLIRGFTLHHKGKSAPPGERGFGSRSGEP
jgi:hypothetical protein